MEINVERSQLTRNGLGAEGFEAPALPNEQQMQLPLAPAEPSLFSRATSTGSPLEEF